MFSHCVALRAIVVVLTLSVGAAMGDDTPPSLGAASAIREADADGGSTADALAAGHQLERMYRTMDFVGVIDFNLTMEGVERQPNSTVKQRGRLYVGRNGAMRLDLWIPATTAHPIVCGIANGKAWMIGGDRAIVLVADYPMDVDSEQTYAYLLQTQVAQTEYYAGRVLFGSPVLSELSQRPLQSARLFGDNLYLEIGPSVVKSGDGDGMAQVKCRIVECAERFLPVCVETRYSTTRLGEYIKLGDGHFVPGKNELFNKEGDRSIVCELKDVRAMGVPEVRAFLRCPDRYRPQAFPELLGKMEFDEQGSPEMTHFPLQ